MLTVATASKFFTGVYGWGIASLAAEEETSTAALASLVTRAGFKVFSATTAWRYVTRVWLPLNLATGVLEPFFYDPINRTHSFLTKHAASFVHLASFVAALLLARSADWFFLIPFGVALVYQKLEHAGFIPQKVALLVERVVDKIGIFGSTFAFGFVKRINLAEAAFGAVVLLRKSTRLLLTIDDATFRFFGAQGPSLRELMSPAPAREIEEREASRILMRSEALFYMNPTYRAFLEEVREDTDFASLEGAVDRADLEAHYEEALKLCLQDPRFVGEILDKIEAQPMREVCPQREDESESDYQDWITLERERNILAYLATTPNGKEEFMRLWVRDKVQELTRQLTGEQRMSGSQMKREEVKSACARIVTLLKGLEVDEVFRKGVVKLSLAGSHDVVALLQLEKDLLLYGLPKDVVTDPSKRYEHEVKVALIKERVHQLKVASKSAGPSPGPSPLLILQKALKIPSCGLGVVPLTLQERSSLDLLSWALWKDEEELRSKALVKCKTNLSKSFSSKQTRFREALRTLMDLERPNDTSIRDLVLGRLAGDNFGMSWQEWSAPIRQHIQELLGRSPKELQVFTKALSTLEPLWDEGCSALRVHATRICGEARGDTPRALDSATLRVWIANGSSVHLNFSLMDLFRKENPGQPLLKEQGELEGLDFTFPSEKEGLEAFVASSFPTLQTDALRGTEIERREKLERLMAVKMGVLKLEE